MNDHELFFNIRLFLELSQAWLDSVKQGDLERAKYYMIPLERMVAERKTKLMTEELSRRLN